MFDSFKKKKDRCNTAICLNKKKIFVNAPMIMTPDCMWSIYIFYYACIISHLLFFFFYLYLLFTWEQPQPCLITSAWMTGECTVTIWLPPSFLPGVLGVFCCGRKWAAFFHLQSPAGYRLLPWLHLTLPPDFWDGCKCQYWITPTPLSWKPCRYVSGVGCV